MLRLRLLDRMLNVDTMQSISLIFSAHCYAKMRCGSSESQCLQTLDVLNGLFLQLPAGGEVDPGKDLAHPCQLAAFATKEEKKRTQFPAL